MEESTRTEPAIRRGDACCVKVHDWFVDSKQHSTIGGLALLACVAFAIVGGQLWSLRTEVYTRERVGFPCPAEVARTTGCLGPYRTELTGSKPNHVPAVLTFVVGGALGLFGVVLVRPRSGAAIRGELPTPN